MRLLIIALCGLISGCGSGVYTPIATGKGDVLVINKFTGAMRRVTDAGISPVTDALPVVDSHTFPATSLAKIPILISGDARYFEEKMLVRITVSRDPMTEWTPWREYMTSAVPIADLHLLFNDKSGFQLASHDLETSSLTRVVDSDGDTFSYTAQIALQMTPEAFRAISTMDVQWSRWPDWKPPVKPSPQ